MKVFFIVPPTGRYMRSDRCQAPVDTRVAEDARPPMDLAYMAAVLNKIGAESRIKDYSMERLGWEEVKRDLSDFMPDVVVIGVTTPTVYEDLRVCKLAKEINPLVRTIAKGAHFFIFDRQILERFGDLDVVIRGEPEITISELMQAQDYSKVLGITFRRGKEIIRNADRPLLENLDDLPFPARDLLNNRLYITPDTSEPIAFITTGRGCPGQCIFCAAELVGGSSIRSRSVGPVVDEIEECIEKYGIRNFFFSADTFTWHKEWVIRFCAEIIKRNIKIRWGANSRVDTLDEERISQMKRAGCFVIGLGAESASQAMLDKMKKGVTVEQIEKAVGLCEKYGIKSFLIFVIGLPWETKKTVNDTIRFVKHSRASFIEVNIAYPLPGTEFYTLARENGLFSEDSLGGHNYSNPAVKSFYLSTAELKKLRKKILCSFYARPGYIFRRMRGINSAGAVLNYFKYGFRLFGNLLKT
ncbi:MAG: radical SAM protein [Candidatus Omnitrophica bacterium]|nr:radical SAM protein [Candidatus Omnitrophota bacterium]